MLRDLHNVLPGVVVQVSVNTVNVVTSSMFEKAQDLLFLARIDHIDMYATWERGMLRLG